MTPPKRRPATPADQRLTKVAKKDSTQQAPKDTPATQGLPRPPRPGPKDSTQQAPIDAPAAQAPIDTPAAGAPIDSPVAQAPIDTPTGQGPTRAAKKDSIQLLGPDGEPIAEEALTGDAGGDSAPSTETGQAAPEGQSPGRSRALPPERVWPD